MRGPWNVANAARKLGLVAALDLNPPKARVLLQLLLANNITDPARIQKEFAMR